MADFRVFKIIEQVGDENGKLLENLIGYALFKGDIYIGAFETMDEVKWEIKGILDYEEQEKKIDYFKLKQQLINDQHKQEELKQLELLHYIFHNASAKPSKGMKL